MCMYVCVCIYIYIYISQYIELLVQPCTTLTFDCHITEPQHQASKTIPKLWSIDHRASKVQIRFSSGRLKTIVRCDDVGGSFPIRVLLFDMRSFKIQSPDDKNGRQQSRHMIDSTFRSRLGFGQPDRGCCHVFRCYVLRSHICPLLLHTNTIMILRYNTINNNNYNI